MDDKITVSAKTLDEAITKALIELQTTSDHLQYEVVQKESSGFLGFIGAKPCVIRARVMSEEEERKIAAEKAAAEKAAAKAAAEKAAAEKAAKAAEEKAAREAAQKASAASETKETAASANCEERSEKSGGRPEKREKKEFQRREGKKEAAPRQETSGKPVRSAEAEPEEKLPKEKPAGKVNEEAVKKAAKDFLLQVFGAMGMEVTIDTVYNAGERELQVMMNGDDMGILIGKRGQTLDSLQYLVSLVVNKETEGYLRVKLDTENYRERRKETLETLARNISYKVKRTKHPVSLEPMNPYERRTIHSALQNDRYVVTRSEGEDPFRHVVISLKKDSYSGSRKERYGSRRSDRSHGEKTYDKTAQKTQEKAESVTEASTEPAETGTVQE